MFTPSHEVSLHAHPSLTMARRFIVSWALPTPTTSLSPSPRQPIFRLSRKPWLLGESLPVSSVVDTSSSLSTTRGDSVPPLRVLLPEGSHSSPGCSGVSLGHLQMAQPLSLPFGPSPYSASACSTSRRFGRGFVYLSLDSYAIDLQEMIWKLRTGFHEQMGVSQKKRYANHAMGGYTREYQDTAQSRHRQRPLQPSSARLSTR